MPSVLPFVVLVLVSVLLIEGIVILSFSSNPHCGQKASKMDLGFAPV
jgi:hypothetical protein